MFNVFKENWNVSDDSELLLCERESDCISNAEQSKWWSEDGVEKVHPSFFLLLLRLNLARDHFSILSYWCGHTPDPTWHSAQYHQNSNLSFSVLKLTFHTTSCSAKERSVAHVAAAFTTLKEITSLWSLASFRASVWCRLSITDPHTHTCYTAISTHKTLKHTEKKSKHLPEAQEKLWAAWLSSTRNQNFT